MLLFFVYSKRNEGIEEGLLSMNSFTEKAIEIIKNIPEGKVMTYGQIANLAGSPRAARQVVRILHSMSKKHRLPWHRVINSKGEIGIQDDESLQEQIFSLEYEGIVIQNNRRIDLEKYQYIPEE
jgi:methylated-DNA-protein-cysteine methyltransferase related protein